MMSQVSVDEYLHSSYEHDPEFVDGVLVERGTPTPAHGTLQSIVVEHLRRYRREFRFGVIPECRVEIVSRSRYRVPDVLLSSLPIPAGKVLDTPPLAVIEIWSPDDGLGKQMARFREYWERGVRQIVVLDPEAFTCLRYHNGSLADTPVCELHLPDDRRVPFPAEALLDELREELARGDQPSAELNTRS
jgi:Uma2 family endonuclease